MEPQIASEERAVVREVVLRIIALAVVFHHRGQMLRSELTETAPAGQATFR